MGQALTHRSCLERLCVLMPKLIGLDRRRQK
jgi:hypothetical protein